MSLLPKSKLEMNSCRLGKLMLHNCREPHRAAQDYGSMLGSGEGETTVGQLPRAAATDLPARVTCVHTRKPCKLHRPRSTAQTVQITQAEQTANLILDARSNPTRVCQLPENPPKT